MLCALAASTAAQTKISALPSATPAPTDVVPFVADPAGTPTTKKTTLSDFFSVLMPSFVGSSAKNGNGSKFQLFTGSFSTNHCAQFDASGNLVDSGGACGGGAAYSVYTALVSQSGTSAPTATVLQNTTGGTIAFARTASGTYTTTISGASFTANKTTFVLYPGAAPAVTTRIYYAYPVYTSTSVITFETRAADGFNGTGGDIDGLMTAAIVEIKIYS
jgi:hypothetical protein